MSTAVNVSTPATVADLRAIPEEQRFHEIIAGELVQKAAPSGPHGLGQSQVVSQIAGPYNRRPTARGPGGWWILTEVEVELTPHDIARPDIVGWRRERMPRVPDESPILLRPDWICEVLSKSNARNDLVKKMRSYQHAGVPHYWIVDPDRQTLSVYRWTEDGYLMAHMAEPGDSVRAEPFVEVELDVGALFGVEAGPST